MVACENNLRAFHEIEASGHPGSCSLGCGFKVVRWPPDRRKSDCGPVPLSTTVPQPVVCKHAECTINSRLDGDGARRPLVRVQQHVQHFGWARYPASQRYKQPSKMMKCIGWAAVWDGKRTRTGWYWGGSGNLCPHNVKLSGGVLSAEGRRVLVALSPFIR